MTSIVRMLAPGITVEQVLEDYPQLALEDIGEALRFAAANVDSRIAPLGA